MSSYYKKHYVRPETKHNYLFFLKVLHEYKKKRKKSKKSYLKNIWRGAWKHTKKLSVIFFKSWEEYVKSNVTTLHVTRNNEHNYITATILKM